MKTNIPTWSVVRRAARVLVFLLLPALAIAQRPAPGPAVGVAGPGEPPPPAPPELKEVPFLGISTHGIDAALAAQMELPPETGLVVVRVLPESPAAGVIQEHDLLTRFEDQILIEPRQLGVLVRSRKEGDEVALTLFRAGKPQTVRVKLGKKAMPPLPARFVPGSRRATRFRADDVFEVEPPMGPGAVRFFSGHPAEMRIARFEGKNSVMVFDDADGRLEVSFKDGKKQLTARGAKGEILFQGPVETAEERKALPAEVRVRLEKMEATDVRMPRPPEPPEGNFRAEPEAFVPAPERGDVLVPAPGIFKKGVAIGDADAV